MTAQPRPSKLYKSCTVLNVKLKCLLRKKTADTIAQIVNYTMTMNTYSITEVCPHDIAYIKVIDAVCGCETTVLTCTECKKELEPPKTEC
ncbi:hypothetical protein [Flavobacterium hydrophilum]|uniref:hypothetical protein n=1 Tax=Flavobacterium hydrophilum TaxID=2211445 RepID=UPI000F509C07|nr:hypothetical protein [Flavobacterium hydrophilum]